MIAPLRWWHLPVVAAIDADVFGAEKWTEAMFWNELANGHHYMCALDAEEVVGFAGLALNPPDEAWVNTIGVARSHQRAGVGAALLSHLLSHATSVGARRVLLEVAADNGPAQRLYDRFGFDTIGVRRGYYQPSNTDALILRRDL